MTTCKPADPTFDLPVGSPLPRAAVAILVASALAGCTVGPNYQRPTAPIASHFKEAEGWAPSHPSDAIDKGAWWSMFGDPVLDGLERRVATSNQTVAQFAAAYRQAHQITAQARSGFFPTLGGSAGVNDSKGGVGRNGGSITTYSTALDASWVPDLWGRLRRTVESDVANAQASAAQIANARLSAEAELAHDYFQLRTVDEQARVYRETVAGYQRFLQLTSNQYQVGVAAKADVVAAQTQLLGAQASLIDTGVSRGQLEHAIATLVGVAPSDLAIAPAALSRDVPVAPTQVASTLLERRPDIAGAERRVASANAQIGVAESAFYPQLSLSGSYGLGASNLGSLFSASSTVWSLGSSLADTLLDFGGRRAGVRASRAFYDEEVAVYRQTVLGAFQNVEDELVALRVLEQEEAVRLQDEQAAQTSQQLALNQYRAGQVNYATVIVAQSTALAASQGVLIVLQQRLQASVGLVEALGGGWTASDLPKG